MICLPNNFKRLLFYQMNNKLNILLIIEQCNPELSSVPLEGYNYYKEINKLSNVTLVTHERNKKALSKHINQRQNEIVYIYESILTKKYYAQIAKLTSIGRINWPLKHALAYPIYAEFNHKVHQKFKRKILEGYYDTVHVITPMMPRYPAKVVKACHNIPFILGPVNGGVPFPSGFKQVAKQESAQFNFLRAIGRALIPGYRETYEKAERVLAGSTYTLKMLKGLFNLSDSQISLFYENGIDKSFFTFNREPFVVKVQVNLLFVGRLVPYKGADMLLEAINRLDKEVKNKIQLTIVGDGSEKSSLEKKVIENNLQRKVNFTGWIEQSETIQYYQKSDIFCFPSIREFGGAVVLEAMACGLPCIVVNNGGIGEYVTDETGFKIDPISREYLIQELSEKIRCLVDDENLRFQMSSKAIERVREFEWSQKAKQIINIYNLAIDRKKSRTC